MKFAPWIVLAVLLVAGVTVFGLYIGANNTEVGLRNAIAAKQDANTATFDNMWKQISQVAQVTDAQKTALKDIFEGYAQARGGADDQPVVKWLTEAVPNVDTSVYKNLQNIIVAARNSFTSDQLALRDLKRAHDDVLTKFPSSLFVGSRPRIEVRLVTSSRTAAAFAAGSDDDVTVFPAKPAAAPEK